jgi:hypothetical protein
MADAAYFVLGFNVAGSSLRGPYGVKPFPGGRLSDWNRRSPSGNANGGVEHVAALAH